LLGQERLKFIPQQKLKIGLGQFAQAPNPSHANLLGKEP